MHRGWHAGPDVGGEAGPALLQTPDYARTLLGLAHDDAHPARLARRVALRAGRQRVLRTDDPPQVWSVVDEAALRREFGDPWVGVLAAAGFPFAILRFPGSGRPDLGYLEQSTSALYPDQTPHVEHYAVAMERDGAGAAPPADTESILPGILRETAR